MRLGSHSEARWISRSHRGREHLPIAHVNVHDNLLGRWEGTLQKTNAPLTQHLLISFPKQTRVLDIVIAILMILHFGAATRNFEHALKPPKLENLQYCRCTEIKGL